MEEKFINLLQNSVVVNIDHLNEQGLLYPKDSEIRTEKICDIIDKLYKPNYNNYELLLYRIITDDIQYYYLNVNIIKMFLSNHEEEVSYSSNFQRIHKDVRNIIRKNLSIHFKYDISKIVLSTIDDMDYHFYECKYIDKLKFESN